MNKLACLRSNLDPCSLKNLYLFDHGELTRGRSFIELGNKFVRWGSNLIALTASARPNFAHWAFPGDFPHFLDIRDAIVSIYSSRRSALRGPDARSGQMDRASGFRAGEE
jgi:hypothetical protein